MPITTSRIVLGSDYPYRTGAEHAKGLAGIFGPEDLRLPRQSRAASTCTTISPTIRKMEQKMR